MPLLSTRARRSFVSCARWRVDVIVDRADLALIVHQRRRFGEPFALMISISASRRSTITKDRGTTETSDEGEGVAWDRHGERSCKGRGTTTLLRASDTPAHALPSWSTLPPMLSFEAARERILALAQLSRAHEQVSLENAVGRVLAHDLISTVDLPGHDHSAMDGYALRLDDLEGDGPWPLEVRGESKTGIAGLTLAPRSACRIFTGAPVPEGADTVVMQEVVERSGDIATFSKRPVRGANIRRRGEDMRSGSTAIAKGTRLSPRHVSMIASLDRCWVDVTARPRVTIVSTGDEIRAPGTPPVAGTIPESIGPALVHMARAAGAIATLAPVVPDDRASTERALQTAIDTSDVVVTVGGASVGDHDLVKPALASIGVDIDFWRVAIKPGKPLLVGKKDRRLVIGLPGNPSSAVVTFVMFGLPLLRALQGDLHAVASPWKARIAAPITRTEGRLELARVTFSMVDGERVATLLSNQASGAVTGLAASDGLIMIPAETTRLEAGDKVDALTWSELGA